MRGLISTGLVLAAAIRLANGSSASAQESRPIAETIRVKPAEEGYRRLPGNILVSSEIAPDLPVLSLPRPDEAQPPLNPLVVRPPIVPPSLVLPPVEAAAPSNQSRAKEPLRLPELDAPADNPAKESFVFPEMPSLGPPSEPGSNDRVHAAPSIIPASAKMAAPNEAGPVPDGTRTGPRVIDRRRRSFWDRDYDPAKDCDREACAEGQSVVLDRNPRSHWWLEADYLHWYTKAGRTPAMLYGGLASVLSTPANPQLGRTFPLYSSLDRDSRSTPGLRLSLGTWFEPSYRWGLEISTTAVFDNSESRNYSSPGDLYLLRPFRDATTGAPSLAQLAGGGTASGSLRVETFQRLVGEEIHILYALRDTLRGESDLSSLNLLFGYRHLQFRERLGISDRSTDFASGDSFASQDDFATWSDFHAGQIGLKASYQSSRWALDLAGKIALGCATQNVTIRGDSTVSPALGGSFTNPGGFYAQPTNIGEFQRQRLVYSPEVGARLSYQFAPNLVGSVGYNFLYISSVVRAADQIDSTINFGGAGAARPAFRWKEDDLWTQGITLGLTLQY